MLGKAKHPRAILVLCVFAVVAIAAVAVLESSGGFAPGQADSTSQIETNYTTHLLDIHYMNVSGIEQGYTKDGSVQFVDTTQKGDNVNYTGTANIGTGYNAAIFPNFALPTILHQNYTVRVEGNQATLNSTFFIQGYNDDTNLQNALVSTHVDYVRQNGAWLIKTETWDITFASVQNLNGVG